MGNANARQREERHVCYVLFSPEPPKIELRHFEDGTWHRGRAGPMQRRPQPPALLICPDLRGSQRSAPRLARSDHGVLTWLGPRSKLKDSLSRFCSVPLNPVSVVRPALSESQSTKAKDG